MTMDLSGIYAAAVTPLDQNHQPILGEIPILLEFLAQRNCSGTLMLGTTGEGPSFSGDERKQIIQSAFRIRETYPDFKILAGTGEPSIDATIRNTKSAFDLGVDGVVVLPPYYFKGISNQGLVSWFVTLIKKAVPADGALFFYNIPAVTGVHLPFEVISQVRDQFPGLNLGIKDSTGDPELAEALGRTFGKDLITFFRPAVKLQRFVLGKINLFVIIRGDLNTGTASQHQRQEK